MWCASGVALWQLCGVEPPLQMLLMMQLPLTLLHESIIPARSPIISPHLQAAQQDATADIDDYITSPTSSQSDEAAKPRSAAKRHSRHQLECWLLPNTSLCCHSLSFLGTPQYSKTLPSFSPLPAMNNHRTCLPILMHFLSRPRRRLLFCFKWCYWVKQLKHMKQVTRKTMEWTFIMFLYLLILYAHVPILHELYMCNFIQLHS